jgi:hypothetical protein
MVFPNGVDVKWLQPASEARTDLRSSLGIDRNPLIILVGNFFQWHDVTTLLAAQILVGYPVLLKAIP